MNEEKIFIDGMIFKQREGTPDFVIGQLSFKVEEFIEFALKHEKNGWLNADLLKSKAGKPYATKNQWEPSVNDAIERSAPPSQPDRKPEASQTISVDDIPF